MRFGRGREKFRIVSLFSVELGTTWMAPPRASMCADRQLTSFTYPRHVAHLDRLAHLERALHQEHEAGEQVAQGFLQREADDDRCDAEGREGALDLPPPDEGIDHREADRDEQQAQQVAQQRGDLALPAAWPSRLEHQVVDDPHDGDDRGCQAQRLGEPDREARSRQKHDPAEKEREGHERNHPCPDEPYRRGYGMTRPREGEPQLIEQPRAAAGKPTARPSANAHCSWTWFRRSFMRWPRPGARTARSGPCRAHRHWSPTRRRPDRARARRRGA